MVLVTANYLPLWSDSNTLTNSIISQSGTAFAQVNGGVRITGNHTDSGSQLNIWCDASGNGGAAVHRWYFYTGGNNARSNLALFLGPTGCVGIGTGTPYRNLHIYQAADGNNYEGALQVGGNSASLGGYFGYNSTSSGRLTISSLNNAGGANAKIFLGFGLDSDGSPATEVMTLTQGGRVGISTASPGDKLHVYGGAAIFEDNGNNINIKNTWSSGNHDINFIGGSSVGGSASNTAARIRVLATAPGWSGYWVYAVHC